MKNKIIQHLKDNIAIILISILAIIFVFKFIDSYQESHRLHRELIGTQQKFKKINEYSAVLQRKYEDQETLLKTVNKDWAKEKAYLKGRIKVLSNATYLIRENARNTNKSDVVYLGKKMKYIVNEIKYENGPAVGYVLIYDDGRVTSRLYNHAIDVKTAISKQEKEGKYSIISKADYILKSPTLSKTGEWYNKPFHLKIQKGTALIDPTEPIIKKKSFYFWTPNYNANLNINSNGLAGGLGISLMGYGYSKRDLDWKFIQLGSQISTDKEFGLTIVPMMYRPFSNILTNTYFGSGILFDSTGYSYFAGIQIGL